MDATQGPPRLPDRSAFAACVGGRFRIGGRPDGAVPGERALELAEAEPLPKQRGASRSRSCSCSAARTTPRSRRGPTRWSTRRSVPTRSSSSRSARTRAAIATRRSSTDGATRPRRRAAPGPSRRGGRSARLYLTGTPGCLARKETPLSTPFLGEIRMFGGNFAPQGWAFCDGRLLSISDNSCSSTLLGTTYGGDGVNKFRPCPTSAARIPVHQGQGFVLGQRAGSEQVTLPISGQIPPETTTRGRRTWGPEPQPAPTGNVWASVADALLLLLRLPQRRRMISGAIAPAGEQPAARQHDALSSHQLHHRPLQGIFPSQN